MKKYIAAVIKYDIVITVLVFLTPWPIINTLMNLLNLKKNIVIREFIIF